jgi:hypothetical protein
VLRAHDGSQLDHRCCRLSIHRVDRPAPCKAGTEKTESVTLMIGMFKEAMGRGWLPDSIYRALASQGCTVGDKEHNMNNLVWWVGAIVIVLFILGYVGFSR